MTKPVKIARKVGVLVVAIPVLVVGVALLVLPGPGLLVILAGLLILSLEFEFAKTYVDSVRKRLGDVNNAVRNRSNGKARKNNDE